MEAAVNADTTVALDADPATAVDADPAAAVDAVQDVAVYDVAVDNGAVDNVVTEGTAADVGCARPSPRRVTIGGTLAVVVARGGQLPPGAAEATAEAGGRVLVLGSGAADAAGTLSRAGGGPADAVWWTDTGPGLRVGALARALAAMLAGADLIVLPASADGRDLAPRLAAELGAPLLAGAVSVTGGPGDDEASGRNGHVGHVVAELSRLEGRLLVTATCPAPAVATLLPGVRSVLTPVATPVPVPAQSVPTWDAAERVAVPAHVSLPPSWLDGAGHPTGEAEVLAGLETIADVEVIPDVEVIEVLEPDPATMDLAEATRVLGGGAGLVSRSAAGAGLAPTAAFELLAQVATALGASAGATRVVTDAGWMGYDRQIGTTGVAVDPDLYIAFGVSGASQHTGGLGAPRHVVSVNLDPSCPMTALADLGLVTDAGALLVELARRLGVPVPAGVGAAGTGANAPTDRPDPRVEAVHG
jgi:electron transfer flavoprotein alpha subunit